MAFLEKDELSKLTGQRNESKNKSQRVILICFGVFFQSVVNTSLRDFHVLL